MKSTKQTNISISKTENKKAKKESMFKASILLSVSIVVFFFFLIIIFLASNGVKGFIEFGELNFNYFMTGNYYDLYSGLLPGGLLVVNTLWTSMLAVLVAVPVSILMALFVTRVVSKRVRPLFFTAIAVLASIPSVIYGAFGLGVIDSLFNDMFNVQGAIISIVFTLAIMIIPTITLITIASINNVDKQMENSSLSLGATRMQTNFYITLKAVSTGILTGSILGIGRALGEASAVSMVASESSTLPAFGLFEHTRLLTSSMLKGFGEISEGSLEQSYMFALGLILMITVLVVFSLLKKIQKSTDPTNVSNNQSKKAEELEHISRTIESGKSISVLSAKQQDIYAEIQMNNIFHEYQNELETYGLNTNEILSKTTVTVNNEKQKLRSSRFLGFLTFSFSLFGIGTLIAIITYLLIDGANYISWDFMTTSGKYETLNGVDIYGMKIPLFGTLVTILTTMVFAIPLGIASGIYFSEFAKENRINKVLITIVELLTSVPSIIFGLIGATLFLPLAMRMNLGVMAMSLTLTFIVVPTIIKTTQESISSVKPDIKEGSLALGATKSTTTVKISIPQALPGIISGTLLAIGRIMGESAALVMIFGTWSKDTMGEWLTEGGTTLSTEIYRLTGDYQELPWEAIKAIGLIIIGFIFMISLLSHFINERRWDYSLVTSIGIVLIFASIFANIIIMFYIGLALLIIPLVIELALSIVTWIKKGTTGYNIPVRVEIWMAKLGRGK